MPEHSEIAPFKEPTKNPPARRLLVTVAVLSFVFGGIGGGLFGLLGASAFTQGGLPTWRQMERLFTKRAVTTSGDATQKAVVQVQEDSTTVDVVERVAPSVVSVILKQDLSKLRQENDPFNEFFFSFPFSQSQQEGKRELSAGSGSIVSSDGLILTNKHVVRQAVDNPDVEVVVVFNDGSEHNATVLGADPLNDIAILKIDEKNLPTVQLGDSDAIELGQTVIAIGNALGERNTVTRGVVSGINRTVRATDQAGSAETIEEAIQTDAAINPGNSGGPLLNLAGQVVGVNTAINESGQNIGFAIPINAARQVIESVQKEGKIVRPYLGVRYVLIDEVVQQENNLKVDYGALIVRGSREGQLAVIPGSPADKAGVVENDIILEVNGQKITSDHTLAGALQKLRVGDAITLKILHKGEEKTVQATLENLEE